jgi:hypothetical protein
LKKGTFLFKETFENFETYMKDWCGYEKRDEKTNKYGYWKNNNAKWDWHELGGRWTGFFKLKLGVEAVTGKPGLMTAEADDGWGDQALKSEIDFEYMKNDVANKAKQEYKFAMSIIGDLPESELWESIRERIKDNDAAKGFYWNQPRQKAWQEKEKSDRKTWPFDFYTSPDDFQMSESDYIQEKVGSAYCPFAIIKDGKWFEKGKMGWWGFVSNEDSEWQKKATELIDGLPDNTMLSLYDCHV